MVWILFGEEPHSGNLNMSNTLLWSQKVMGYDLIKINHNKWNVILKYKEQKVEPEQSWCKFMRICSWRATPTSKREEELKRKDSSKEREVKTTWSKTRAKKATWESTTSPGHWSIWGTTNPEGKLPGYSTNMWKTLQIVCCFSQVIFFQKNSLLSGFRRNPLWSQNQMRKCLTTCRVLSARRKVHTQLFGDKAQEAAGGKQWEGCSR